MTRYRIEKGVAMEDCMIVDLYWKRDERAIEETDKKYNRYLYKIACNILNNSEDTNESINDTYFAAWNSIPPNKPNVLSTYLGKLIRRIAIDIYRKKSRQKRKGDEYALSLSELSECVPDDSLLEERLEAELLSEKISEFLRDQKEETRNIFVCRYYYFDSVENIARCLGISKAKVKTVLHRTRLELKKHLEKGGFIYE